jgi:putative hemolysin
MDRATSIILHLVGLGFLLSLSAFFSGSETALFSLGKSQIERLRQSNSKLSKAVAVLLDKPRRLLITILVGNMFVNVASGSLIGSFATAILGNRGVGIGVAVTTILLLIFGEVTPKTISVHHAEPIAKFVAYPINFFSKCIFPLRITLRFVTNFLMRLMGVGDIPAEDRLTTEELKVMVEIAEEEGSIKQHERHMIDTIFDLRNITAAEIMVPRTEMICVPEDSTLQQIFDLARNVGRSRVPVYKNDIDHITGIAYIRDFPMWRYYDIKEMTIEQFQKNRQKIWPRGGNTLIRPPFFVPEARTAMELFQDLRDRRIQMAILLDEYGGTAGLVTMEDLVEELIGELNDEYGTSSQNFRVLDDSTTLVSGRMSIRNVNRKLALNLPSEENIGTIGGYVLHLFGRVPDKGEIFLTDDLEFRVEGVEKQRITYVAIKKFESLDSEEYDLEE